MKKILFTLLCCFPVFSNAQIITTIAGTGVPGAIGNGGPATAAQLNGPGDVTTDAAGNIYITDFNNNQIRKVNTSGIISLIAGVGSSGYSGDGGSALTAELNNPNGPAVDAVGNLYFADYSNHCIRKINTSGIISTIAGNGSGGFSGDGGPATLAQLSFPVTVHLDGLGNICFADGNNHRIRKIDASGMISTIAGNGSFTHAGDGGPATLASLYDPFAITFDASGNMYIADQDNNCIRKVDISGIITTIAGNVTPGYTGDGGPASAALISRPCGISVDIANNIYFADRSNNCIRKISTTGNITTVAGTSTAGYSGDGGPATAAKLNGPSSIFVDVSGNMFIADILNNRVRKISSACPDFTNQPKNDTVLVGQTAKYWVKTPMPSPVYQWQEDHGAGFVNLTNVLPYSGVNTDTLKIASVVTIYDHSHYRCFVSSEGLCVDTSSSAILIIHGGVGVAQLSAESVNIFPNPAHNEVIVELPQQIAKGSIQLLNAVGIVLIEKNITGNSNKIDLALLPAGMYILKVQADGNAIYKKILKN